MGVTMAKGASLMAKKGVIVKKLTAIPSFGSMNILCTDKTGTLTEGRLKVLRSIERNPSPWSQSQTASLIYQLSVQSEHPISRALVQFYADNVTSYGELQNVNEIAGEGIYATFENKKIALLKSRDSDRSSSGFFVEGKEIIHFEFEDEIRKETKEVLKDLSVNLNYTISILSGDQKKEVEKFMSSFQNLIDAGFSDLLPADKAKLQKSKDVFVGDGLNDAQAMCSAGLGIGFLGSAEANTKAADVYLLKKDLRLIPLFLRALKRSQTTVNLNYGISILYNIVCIALVLKGFVGPVVCAVFMPLSSFSVIALSILRPSYVKI
jgi:P-type E1-E2 ATPase